jgi:nucleotide-binding universal stress UspA family protein
MEYRTILVDIDPSSGVAGRIEFAAQLATAQQAHLIGLTQTGILRFIRESEVPGADFGSIAPLFAQLREDADRRASQFDELVRQAGVPSFEHRVGDDDPGNALATQAMYADLAIVSQRQPAKRDVESDAAVPEYVAMNAPCPVLVLPSAGNHAPTFERVLVGWNASPESARAVRQALPFLKQAKQVDVAIVDSKDARRASRPMGSRDIVQFLARHGITAGIREPRAVEDAGQTLLALSGECGAGLLVVGCYGHSRFRELLLGGVSRTVLRHMNLPVLMAH